MFEQRIAEEVEGIYRDLKREDTPDAGAAVDGRPLFSVLDYGAVGDGTTDDTAAFQAAADAAEAYSDTNGIDGIVWVPRSPTGSFYSIGSPGLSSGVSILLDDLAGVSAAAGGYHTIALTGGGNWLASVRGHGWVYVDGDGFAAVVVSGVGCAVRDVVLYGQNSSTGIGCQVGADEVVVGPGVWVDGAQYGILVDSANGVKIVAPSIKNVVDGVRITGTSIGTSIVGGQIKGYSGWAINEVDGSSADYTTCAGVSKSNVDGQPWYVANDGEVHLVGDNSTCGNVTAGGDRLGIMLELPENTGTNGSGATWSAGSTHTLLFEVADAEQTWGEGWTFASGRVQVPVEAVYAIKFEGVMSTSTGDGDAFDGPEWEIWARHIVGESTVLRRLAAFKSDFHGYAYHTSGPVPLAAGDGIFVDVKNTGGDPAYAWGWLDIFRVSG